MRLLCVHVFPIKQPALVAYSGQIVNNMFKNINKCLMILYIHIIDICLFKCFVFFTKNTLQLSYE